MSKSWLIKILFLSNLCLLPIILTGDGQHKQVACPFCHTQFEVIEYSEVEYFGMDTDFRTQYKTEGVYENSIYVCPHCNYATWGADFSKPLDLDQMRAIDGRLSGHRNEYEDYFEIPVHDRFAYAGLTYEAMGRTSIDLAYLYLTASWACRENDDIENERNFQNLAIQKLKRSIDEGLFNQDYDGVSGQIMETNITYLIGELYRRIGNLDQAKIWIAKAQEMAIERNIPNIRQLSEDILYVIDEVENPTE